MNLSRQFMCTIDFWQELLDKSDSVNFFPEAESPNIFYVGRIIDKNYKHGLCTV